MKRIKSIYFKSLRNEAHYQYLSVYEDTAETRNIAELLPVDLWNLYKNQLAKENSLLDLSRKSELTCKIAEADAREDRALVGMKGAIVSGLHHFDPETADAARILNDRLKPFGRIARKPYEEEVAAVTVLLREFNGDYAPQVAKLGLQPWITELTEANVAFQQLYMSRNASVAAKPDGNIVEIRRQIDATYHEVADYIESLILINPSAALDTFAKLINVQIDYFMELARRSTKLSLDTAVFDFIPPQPFNGGEPVTPMPVVHYNEKKLYFDKDYRVSYRNNIKVGTASIVITGKGAYAGRREITFNIIDTETEN
jgi:hypothetical protein